MLICSHLSDQDHSNKEIQGNPTGNTRAANFFIIPLRQQMVQPPMAHTSILSSMARLRLRSGFFPNLLDGVVEMSFRDAYVNCYTSDL